MEKLKCVFSHQNLKTNDCCQNSIYLNIYFLHKKKQKMKVTGNYCLCQSYLINSELNML